jgi:hypothetical protein
LHLECEKLGDAYSGKPKTTVSRGEFVRLMKQDLAPLRTAMAEARLA